MGNKPKILLIEDEPTMRIGMSHLLSSAGYNVKSYKDGEEGIAAIEREAFDLVITDMRLPGFDGLAVLKRVKALSPSTGVIIITAYAEVKTAVQAIKDGAFDYISKPFSNDELLILIERFLRLRNLETELSRLREKAEKSGFEKLIGVSPSMKAIFDRIEAIADTDVPVLIQGESGTGKELVANAIHNLSSRREKEYVKINCAAIPENLFESEIFGHEKGAFTGASEMRKGKFELANGGTLFFDEIGDMPLGLQAKLLRVIEENILYRLGGSEPIKVNVRGIYATSKNLKELIKKGLFRDDLFYRINVVPVIIPPLRERREDIPCLIDYFLELFSNKYSKPDTKISPIAYERLISYSYPGNVRELKHAMERAVLLSRNGLVDINDLPEEISGIEKEKPRITLDLPLHEGVTTLEREMILNALRASGGRKTEAAKKLGISRKVLWKKMREYKIDFVP